MKEFRSFSITHKGAKHDDSEACQDASGFCDELDRIIIAVADGHGSKRCFRSDIGSARVIEAAITTITHFVGSNPHGITEADDFLPLLHNEVRQIINKWFIAVMNDEETHPLADDPRMMGVTQKYRDRYLNDSDYRCHAYGTTLMVAVMGKDPDYWFGFQVGDGKCVVLYEDGTWKLPIPWDDRCSFNTTTSICDDDSLAGFRYWFGFGDEVNGYREYGYGVAGQGKDYGPVATKSRPLAIFVASDGVEDSYPRIDNDKYVINFYRNRIVSLAEEGWDVFKEEIDGFSKRFADRESTDDVSVAVIVGDITVKADMIAAMKRESLIHETAESAAVKRRDANEKRDALTAVESRSQTVMKNLNQLEDKIAGIAAELSDMDEKVSLLEAAIEKSEWESETSEQEMNEAKHRTYMLEKELTSAKSEKVLMAAKIKVAYDETREANTICDRAEREYESRQKAFLKGKDAYVKQQRKSTTGKSVSMLNKAPEVVTPVTLSPAGVVPDVRLNTAKQTVIKLKDELKRSETDMQAAKNTAFDKGREITRLTRELDDIENNTKRIERSLEQSRRGSHDIEKRSRRRASSIRQHQIEIADIKQEYQGKQKEIVKLNDELETLKEQTKKQTDTLTAIREAWEKAEAEAVALEDKIKNIENTEE
jgi:predicted  nucleic acid-binding Zn-ribbon protein